MSGPTVVKAQLIPFDGDAPSTLESERVVVHFNPATLKLTYANSIKADAKAKGERGKAAQFVDKSSTSLSVELLFDTSREQTDVRAATQRIAERFVRPQGEEGDEKKDPPLRCRLQWGAFRFDGMVETYSETIDFFAPEGIPLRATVALTLKEDAYQFEREDVTAAKRAIPAFTGTSPGTPVESASSSAGKDPADWRDTAMFNGTENPRRAGSNGLSVPRSGPNESPGGYDYGDSSDLGTGIPGAF